MPRTGVSLPTMRAAWRNVAASPMAMGRHNERTVGCVRALITISAPAPLASPMVTPRMGRLSFMSACLE